MTAVCGVVALSLVACSADATKKKVKADGGEVFEEDPSDPVLDPARPPDYNNEDSGAFEIPERQNNGSTADGGARTGVDGGDLADGGVALCSGPLEAGDVKIVEIMISAADGAGDKGEWVEIQSTRTCKLNVKGLTISSPRGTASSDSVTIADDLILPPDGSFIVAGSSNSASNHGLTGTIVSWNAADVLKNDGDTIDVKSGATVIDTLTYPKFATVPAGRSISFPLDCTWSDRSSWERWSYSFDTFSSTFQGTPNTDNDDVACY
jgi:Lamin Tail Domain